MEAQRKRILMKQLLPVIAKHFDIEPEQLLSHSRKRKFTKPRHAFFWMCHVQLDKSYHDIARFMNRDHTTILYGVRRCREGRWLTHDDAQKLLSKASKEAIQ